MLKQNFVRTPVRRSRPAVGMLLILPMLACAASLGDCAGSSTSAFSNTETNSVAAVDPPENAVASPDVTAFAPTSSGSRHSRAAAEAEKITAAATPGNGAYKIGPLDVLDVSVFKVPDLTKTLQVGDDGKVSFPLIGDVQAAGKTTHEVEREIALKLGDKYLRSPQVTVFVREYNSQRVTVEGAVKNTGVYPMKGRTSLVQAIAMAGGVDTTVGSSEVIIFRNIDGKRSAARLDIDSIKKGDAEDPDLQPNDVVVAETSNTKVALHNILSVLPLATATAVFMPLL